MADGKIFVGTENGKFFIVRPHADRAEILSEVELPLSKNSIGGSEGTGGAGVRRRGHFARPCLLRVERCDLRDRPETAEDPDGLGRRRAGRDRRGRSGVRAGIADGARARAGPHGQADRAIVRRRGRFLREEKATWSLDGLKGTVTDGAFTVGADRDRAGRPHQGHRRHAHRRGARARRAAAAVGARRSSRWRRKRSLPAGSMRAARSARWRSSRSTARKCCRRRRRTRSSSAGASSSALSSGRTTRCRPTCARRHGGA